MADVGRAHELMESGTHTGKILLWCLDGAAGYRGAMSDSNAVRQPGERADGRATGHEPARRQPDGAGPRGPAAAGGEGGTAASPVMDLVEQPAKVMRIGA